jgi:hypothetical protein
VVARGPPGKTGRGGAFGVPWDPVSTGEPTDDRTSPVWSLLLAALCLVVSGLLGWRALDDRRAVAHLQRHGLPAVATAVEVDHDSYCWAGTGYAGCRKWTDVTVTFTDASGATRRATHVGDGSTRVGDIRPIVYDPREPTRVLWRDGEPWPWRELVMATITAVAGVWLTLAARRRIRDRGIVGANRGG